MGGKVLRKRDRELCWKARDNYYRCMNEEVKPHLKLNESKKIFEAQNLPALMKKCQPLQDDFTQKCPVEWQQHFDKIWNAEIYNLLSKSDS